MAGEEFYFYLGLKAFEIDRKFERSQRFDLFRHLQDFAFLLAPETKEFPEDQDLVAIGGGAFKVLEPSPGYQVIHCGRYSDNVGRVSVLIPDPAPFRTPPIYGATMGTEVDSARLHFLESGGQRSLVGYSRRFNTIAFFY